MWGRLVQGAVTIINWPFTAASLQNSCGWAGDNGFINSARGEQSQPDKCRSTGCCPAPPTETGNPFRHCRYQNVPIRRQCTEKCPCPSSLIMRDPRPLGIQRSRDPKQLVSLRSVEARVNALTWPSLATGKLSWNAGISSLEEINWPRP